MNELCKSSPPHPPPLLLPRAPNSHNFVSVALPQQNKLFIPHVVHSDPASSPSLLFSSIQLNSPGLCGRRSLNAIRECPETAPLS